MEEVLDVYKRPPDPARPVVCMDEMPKQLIGEIRPPQPVQPGRPKRRDYEYVRHGTASVFMFFSPTQHWRSVRVRHRHTGQDWAHEIKRLVDQDFPDAERIVLVMDNLSTHRLSSLYATFPAVEAHRLASKLEIHHTPKHGSWLNMAELELSVLHRQAMKDRIPSFELLCQRAKCWTDQRNAKAITVNWQFTTEDARIKLTKLYPSL